MKISEDDEVNDYAMSSGTGGRSERGQYHSDSGSDNESGNCSLGENSSERENDNESDGEIT